MSVNAPVRFQVVVKRHARERARLRFPDMKLARISDEVRDAVQEGRVSADRPSWLAPPVDLAHAHSLYAWTPMATRTYVLHALKDRFVVMSVMRRAEQRIMTLEGKRVKGRLAEQARQLGHPIHCAACGGHTIPPIDLYWTPGGLLLCAAHKGGKT